MQISESERAQNDLLNKTYKSFTARLVLDHETKGTVHTTTNTTVFIHTLRVFVSLDWRM